MIVLGLQVRERAFLERESRGERYFRGGAKVAGGRPKSERESRKYETWRFTELISSRVCATRALERW